MANIPNEVMHLCILPQLLAISLIRFKCVSKTWLALISSPDFIRLHHRHVHSSDKNRLLIVQTTPFQRFHLHDLDSPSTPPLHLPYPKPAMCTTPMVVDVIASCEFFLLLSCSLHHNTARKKQSDQNFMNSSCLTIRYPFPIQYESEFYGLFLLNPATGSYYKIPHESPPCAYHRIYGLYLDEANNDCKIMRVMANCSVMVYSLKTNSWKLIEPIVNSSLRVCTGAIRRQLCHWIYGLTNNEKRIYCFDILAEQWTNDIPLLDNCNPRKLTNYDVCILDGLLYVVGSNDYFRNNYQVWVMKEYGVKESWVELMNTVPIDFEDCTPITYCTESQHEPQCTRPRCLLNLLLNNIKDKTSISGHVCEGTLINFP